MIKSISHEQTEIIKSILELNQITQIDLDPTYSKGNFYKDRKILQPKYKSDLYPCSDDIECFDASKTKFENDSLKSIMFDPPFLVGYTKEMPTGKMGKRFNGFRDIKSLWGWYEKCLIEFNRILCKGGLLIFKCQDTVSAGKQHLSHVHIINSANQAGFYTKDLFILLAKNRMVGHNHKIQKHARKFHSYFLVFVKT
jgi:hypothetical protein